MNFPPHRPLPYYFCCGLFISGLVLVGIGLAVGRIGQSARPADQPPDTAVVASTAPPVVTTASHNGSDSATPLAQPEREVVVSTRR